MGKLMITAAGFAVLVMATVALSPTDARATFIEGTIGFGGQWIPLDGSGNETSILDATQVDVVGDQAIVTAASGDIFGLFFSLADYNDFSFDPFVPATPLWSVDIFSFDLLSVSIDVQTQNTLGLIGSGILMGIGFDDTLGEFTFTGDGSGGIFTFSNTASSYIPVSEPGTLALFGIGLISLGFLHRVLRRRARLVGRRVPAR